MIVVGCGKAKREHTAEAQELYTGSLFRAAARYARAANQPWGILSARYGFVLPGMRLEPYDQVLTLTGEDLGLWALREAKRLRRDLDGVAGDRVTCLMGAAYAVPFCRALRSLGFRTFEPLEGMGMGKRLSWLSQQAARLELVT